MITKQTLTRLRDRGVILTADNGRLNIDAPSGVITKRIRDWLTANNADLLKAISPPVPSLTDENRQDILESIEERAAIREFDGNQSREEAEQQACSASRVYRYRLTDKPGTWLTLICPGCDLEEARHVLDLKFGARVVDVAERQHQRR